MAVQREVRAHHIPTFRARLLSGGREDGGSGREDGGGGREDGGGGREYGGGSGAFIRFF